MYIQKTFIGRAPSINVIILYIRKLVNDLLNYGDYCICKICLHAP